MFDIAINLFIISVDTKANKKYILSQDKDSISIPRLNMKDLDKDKIKPHLTEYIRNIVPMHILGIIPQIISLHSSSLATTYKKLSLIKENYSESQIESVYGCLTDYIPTASENFHWIEFRYEVPNDYSANIFEVCQNLT